MRRLVCEYYDGVSFGKFCKNFPYIKGAVSDLLIGDLFDDLFFVFQAEDGIRGFHVTGVQTCALPISALDQAQVVAATKPPAQLGRPAIDADVVVVHVATRVVSRILAIDLAAGRSRIVRSSERAQLTNPSLLAGQLLYVRQTSTAQLLEIGHLTGGRDCVLYRLGTPATRDRGYERGHSRRTRTPRPKRAAGTLWTTALSERTAYVTFVPRKRGAAAASIVAVTR